MDRLRGFVKEDIHEVADLWQRVFRKRDPPSPESLRRYFEEEFFDNPCSPISAERKSPSINRYAEGS